MSDYPWTQEDRTELTDEQAVMQAEIENAEVDKVLTDRIAQLEKQVAQLTEKVRYAYAMINALEGAK